MVTPLGRRYGKLFFTPGEFTPVNIKNCGNHNVRKHRNIKDSDKQITLDTSLKFGSLDKVKIIPSHTRDYLGISGKRLITSLVLKTNVRPKKKKKVKVCHY